MRNLLKISLNFNCNDERLSFSSSLQNYKNRSQVSFRTKVLLLWNNRKLLTLFLRGTTFGCSCYATSRGMGTETSLRNNQGTWLLRPSLGGQEVRHQKMSGIKRAASYPSIKDGKRLMAYYFGKLGVSKHRLLYPKGYEKLLVEQPKVVNPKGYMEQPSVVNPPYTFIKGVSRSIAFATKETVNASTPLTTTTKKNSDLQLWKIDRNIKNLEKNDIENLDKYISIEYPLETYHRSNQDTCLLHKPAVFEGQWVESGDLLADCSASVGGELSLGQNILIGYMPWEGYNFEDAILISERLVYDDLYTSIHIERYEVTVEETKLGVEEITREIPEVQEKSLRHLNSLGIAKLGSWVEEGDILIGKVTPINKKNQSNYQKLLYLILDKTVSPVRDSSLRAPKGIKAKVIGIQIFKNNRNTLLSGSLPLPPSLYPLKGVTESSREQEVYQEEIKENETAFSPAMKSLTNTKSYVNLTSEITDSPFLPPLQRGLKGVAKHELRKKLLVEQPSVVNPKGYMEQPSVVNPHALQLKGEVSRYETQEKEGLNNQVPWLFRTSKEVTENRWKKQQIESFSYSHTNFFLSLSPCESENSSSIYHFPYPLKRVKQSNPPFSSATRRTVNPPSIPLSSFTPHTLPPLAPPEGRVKRGKMRKKGGLVEGREKRNRRNEVPHEVLLWRTPLRNNQGTWLLRPLFTPPLGGAKGGQEVSNQKMDGCRDSVGLNKPHVLLSKKILEEKKNTKSYKKGNNRSIYSVIEKTKPSLSNSKEQKTLLKGISSIQIYLAERRRVQVGDKMAGRHGNKGIISEILPIEDLPYLPDGTPLDMVLNPLGVPSRMNVGQIYECLLGLAGKHLGENFKVFPFDEIYGAEASRSFVYSKLYNASVKTGKTWLFNPNFPGKLCLYDGRTGDSFHQAITVGYAYILRLVHMVDDKMHCLTPDHDVLTNKGWISVDNITWNDKIATLKKNGQLVYQRPTNIFHYKNYKGSLYHIKNNTIDLLVTPKHRMYVKKNTFIPFRVNNRRLFHKQSKPLFTPPYPSKMEGGAKKGSKSLAKTPYELIEAKNLIGKNYRYLKNAHWIKKDYQFVLPSIVINSLIIPEKIMNMNAWLIFLGLWISGNCLVETDSCFEKLRVCKSLVKLLVEQPSVVNPVPNPFRGKKMDGFALQMEQPKVVNPFWRTALRSPLGGMGTREGRRRKLKGRVSRYATNDFTNYDEEVLHDSLCLALQDFISNPSKRQVSCKITLKLLKTVINKLGYQYKIVDHKLCINDQQLWSYLKTLTEDLKNKFLPSWVWQLSQKQSQLLLSSIMASSSLIGGKQKDETASIPLSSFVEQPKVVNPKGFALQRKLRVEQPTVVNPKGFALQRKLRVEQPTVVNPKGFALQRKRRVKLRVEQPKVVNPFIKDGEGYKDSVKEQPRNLVAFGCCSKLKQLKTPCFATKGELVEGWEKRYRVNNLWLFLTPKGVRSRLFSPPFDYEAGGLKGLEKTKSKREWKRKLKNITLNFLINNKNKIYQRVSNRINLTIKKVDYFSNKALSARCYKFIKKPVYSASNLNLIFKSLTVNCQNSCINYYTPYSKLADDIMRLALHSGWSANKSISLKNKQILKKSSETKSFINTMLTTFGCSSNPFLPPPVREGLKRVKGEVQELGITLKQSFLSQQIEEFIPYMGSVFCLTVPNEVFYVRRNGLAIWTGNSRSTGPYSLVTQQPLRGRSKHGGQRLGEMEVWALEGYGAAFTLLEMLTIKSDDMSGRMTLWSNLILNKEISIGTPESFKVLICELQALCLDIGLFRMIPSKSKLGAIPT